MEHGHEAAMKGKNVIQSKIKHKTKSGGGWHIKTKDGQTFSDLTLEAAFEIYNKQESEEESYLLKFEPKNEQGE